MISDNLDFSRRLKMKYLKDVSGKILGRIMDTSNNTQTGYDDTGKYKGKYDKGNDTTYDNTGKNIGKGNQLSNLILDD